MAGVSSDVTTVRAESFGSSAISASSEGRAPSRDELVRPRHAHHANRVELERRASYQLDERVRRAGEICGGEP